MRQSLTAVLLLSATLAAQTRPHDARAREIYEQLIAINTTDTPAGNVTTAANAMCCGCLARTASVA